jgi:hypothetical protein
MPWYMEHLQRRIEYSPNNTDSRISEAKRQFYFNTCTNLHETWYVQHDMSSAYKDLYNISLRSVTPSLQTLGFLRQTILNDRLTNHEIWYVLHNT